MSDGADIDALLGALRPIAAREIAPAAARWDASGALEADVAARVNEWGMFGVSVPEGQGGVGAGMLGAAAVVEEVASHSGALAMRLALHEAVAIGFALGTGDAGLLSRLVEATAFVGMIGVGRGLQASRSGDRVRVHGSATMVPGDGEVVVFARDGEHTVAGLVDGAALRDRRHRNASGLRAVGWSDVTVDATLERVVDGELAAMLAGRLSVLVAATACGLARAAIGEAAQYALVREQFGQPIAQFQAIQWKLANAATERAAAWQLAIDAASRIDRGAPGAVHAAARAQLAAVRSSVVACSDALQIHGGYGYTREFPVERLLRDARACGAIDRGDDELRADVAAAIVRRFA
jgi:hypothetical protein